MASINKAGDTFYGAVYFVAWGPVAETATFLRVPVLIVAKSPRGVVAGVHKVRRKSCLLDCLRCLRCSPSVSALLSAMSVSTDPPLPCPSLPS
jgi:hypothetical protein